MSGYLTMMPRLKKNAGLVASLRKKSPSRVWAILSPTALRYFTGPMTLGGKEQGSILLKDAAFIVPTEDDASGASFTLVCEPLGKGQPDAVFRVDSCHPAETVQVWKHIQRKSCR